VKAMSELGCVNEGGPDEAVRSLALVLDVA
jgi:hypothetical protein